MGDEQLVDSSSGVDFNIGSSGGNWVWIVVFVIVFVILVGGYFVFFGGSVDGSDGGEGESGCDSLCQEGVGECELLESLIDKIICYVDLAKREESVEVCRLSDDSGVKYQCIAIYAEYAKDEGLCVEIPSDDGDMLGLRDVCYADVAKVKENALICEEVVTIGLKDGCYYKVSGETGDKSLCEKIVDEGLRGGCVG